MYSGNVNNDYILNNTNYQLIDIRYKYEYELGAIPGAKLIELYNLHRGISKLDKDKPIIVYCRSGMRSVPVAIWLTNHGFETYNLEHGIAGWIRGGNAIE